MSDRMACSRSVALLLASFFAAGSSQDGQPRAAQGSPGSMADSFLPLEWRDINLVEVTDVHGWISGHPHRDHTANDSPSTPGQIETAVQDADYGDLVSLIERLKAEGVRRGASTYPCHACSRLTVACH